MTRIEVKQYQEFVCNSLKDILGENLVKKEWNVAKDSGDDFTRPLYCPRLDIAVGPFNIDENVYHNNLQIENAVNNHGNFLDKMLHYSELPDSNITDFLAYRNINPRCFLAIEIEKSGSSKHMLGNIANVSILGSIGIVVPFNKTQLSLCKRIIEYLIFVTYKKKVKEIFKNVLVINRENFRKCFMN